MAKWNEENDNRNLGSLKYIFGCTRYKLRNPEEKRAGKKSTEKTKKVCEYEM